MKLEETGLTFEDIKEKVNKYMIETYERMDFWQKVQKTSISTMRRAKNIWIFMQVSQ